MWYERTEAIGQKIEIYLFCQFLIKFIGPFCVIGEKKENKKYFPHELLCI